jgi:hypothetical protein
MRELSKNEGARGLDKNFHRKKPSVDRFQKKLSITFAVVRRTSGRRETRG